MKTKISLSVLLIIVITSFITVMGQETTDKKKQEEAVKKHKEQVSVIIDSKKDTQKELQEVMEESLAAEEKALKVKKEKGYLSGQEYYKQAEALQDAKKKLQLQIRHGNPEPAFNYSFSPGIRWESGEPGLADVYNLYSGRRENTSLSISKTLEDVTFSTDFTYDVKAESSNVSFFVTGTMKAGELKITLKKPDKIAFQEITISPLADVNWNQTFSWDEDETDGNLGKWIISIAAAKANGNYRVQVNSR